jgi:predicted transcriptional regulator
LAERVRATASRPAGDAAGSFEKGKMKKLTLSLSDKEYELIQALADEREKGKTEVIRDALKMKDYLEKRAADGAEVVLKKGGRESILPIELFR